MFPYELNDFTTNKSHKFHYKIIKIIIIKVVLYDKFYNIIGPLIMKIFYIVNSVWKKSKVYKTI